MERYINEYMKHIQHYDYLGIIGKRRLGYQKFWGNSIVEERMGMLQVLCSERYLGF